MKRRVLFLDDRPSDIKPLMDILAHDGVEVLKAVTASEGREELERCIAERNPIALLILDIGFPAQSLMDLLKAGREAVRNAPAADLWQGATLYSELRQEYPELKIIIYSVRSKQEIETQFPNTKFDCPFLRKAEANPLDVYLAIKKALE